MGTTLERILLQPWMGIVSYEGVQRGADILDHVLYAAMARFFGLVCSCIGRGLHRRTHHFGASGTLEVAREILHTHKWGVPDYETFVVYHTFGESSVDFTVMLRAKEYFNRFSVKSAFIKALHKRFADEGITIPFPIRAVNFEQEQAIAGRQKKSQATRGSHAQPHLFRSSG